ncbi:hypothetical protein V5O48_000627 [Marasmius crinis-equi]|uniref:FAD/NAD(P)-binding domain-containing protein n=1 Tax=Marasmius crinis-equi TaxID=585013 RepID=A0ABR3G0M9_9AGAR
MSAITADVLALDWLNDFGAHLAAGNVDGVVSCFREDGWLRDFLIFSWNNRTLHSSSKISAFLRDNLKPNTLSNFQLDDRPFLGPEKGHIMPAMEGVSSGFTFDTPIARGRGFVRLADEGSGRWKALSVLMTMDDLKGHEEQGHENGMWGDHTLAWGEVKLERAKRVEEDPQVLIVGGGQSGLIVAARFKQMQIPTLIVERNPRIGDNWRQRYPTLSLHTTKYHHSMLYQPYPANWPLFTPRDKLANWLEQYAESQDLVVWTNSEPLPTPKYDFDTKKWTVHINRNGQTVTIHPFHIVLATGVLGGPKIPPILRNGSGDFKGRVLHAHNYSGGQNFSGKRVVVVGSGNTSADICQDLDVHGASVTMVQRSTTSWPGDIPTDVADFKLVATPFLLLKKAMASVAPYGWQVVDKDMIEGLRKCGMDINLGPDGTGNLFLVYDRGGGFWVDVGCAQLIIDGKIKVKTGVEIQEMTGEDVHFTDGSSLQADAVIFATGYENMRDDMKQTFGEETIDMTGPVWGLDEEGELRGSYRQTGHPGLWYAPGDFLAARFYSKPLALLFKAIELGHLKL